MAPKLNHVTKAVMKYGIPFESSIWMEKGNIMFKTRKKKISSILTMNIH